MKRRGRRDYTDPFRCYFSGVGGAAVSTLHTAIAKVHKHIEEVATQLYFCFGVPLVSERQEMLA